MYNFSYSSWFSNLFTSKYVILFRKKKSILLGEKEERLAIVSKVYLGVIMVCIEKVEIEEEIDGRTFWSLIFFN